jgi:hypothetical protein
MKLTTTIALCLGVAQQALAFQGWIDSTIAHTGEPVGKEIDYDGCGVTSLPRKTKSRC